MIGLLAMGSPKKTASEMLSDDGTPKPTEVERDDSSEPALRAKTLVKQHSHRQGLSLPRSPICGRQRRLGLTTKCSAGRKHCRRLQAPGDSEEPDVLLACGQNSRPV